MNRILLLALLIHSAVAQGDDAALANAVNARIAQLQTEVWQLDEAIYKLGNLSLSDIQMYELIAEQSFSATEEVVSSYGLTLKQLYFYEANHAEALAVWLQKHPDQEDQINVLTEEIMTLQLRFDRLIQPGSG